MNTFEIELDYVYVNGECRPLMLITDLNTMQWYPVSLPNGSQIKNPKLNAEGIKNNLEINCKSITDVFSMLYN